MQMYWRVKGHYILFRSKGITVCSGLSYFSVFRHTGKMDYWNTFVYSF